ncbi:MAG: LytR/AlgR family response regulator transcription factor [Bariatricus sp.]
MINVYLCEDEEMQLEYFRYQISQYIEENQKDARMVSARRNPEDTYNDAMKLGSQPSLFIIDIDLPGFSMDGFQLVQKLEESRYPYWYVFLTAKSELAYKVFDYRLRIIDYLVKKPELFQKNEVSEEVINRFNMIFEQIEREHNKPPKRIWVGDKTRKNEVLVDQIIFVQTVKGKHSVEIYSTEKTFITRKTIKEMEELLGNEFILISNFCIISKRHIKGVDATNRTVSLTNGYECGISKRHVQEVMELCEEGK